MFFISDQGGKGALSPKIRAGVQGGHKGKAQVRDGRKNAGNAGRTKETKKHGTKQDQDGSRIRRSGLSQKRGVRREGTRAVTVCDGGERTRGFF